MNISGPGKSFQFKVASQDNKAQSSTGAAELMSTQSSNNVDRKEISINQSTMDSLLKFNHQQDDNTIDQIIEQLFEEASDGKVQGNEMQASNEALKKKSISEFILHLTSNEVTSEKSINDANGQQSLTFKFNLLPPDAGSIKG